MLRIVTLLLCLTAPTISFAQNITVFKCIINGIPTFSQFPCAKNAQPLTLKNINITQANRTSSEKPPLADGSVDDYLEIQQIERDIKRLQLQIKQYQQQYAEQKQQIDYMTQDKANRLGASSIASAIASKTSALKQKFDPKIEQAQQQIQALTQKKQILSEKP